MQTLGTIVGVLVILGALIGFFRSLWRPPGRTGGNRGHGELAGESVDRSSSDFDGGGHGGAGGESH